MKALRLLVGLLLLSVATAPLVFHFAFAGPYLVSRVGTGAAVIHLVGCVLWLLICWSIWPAPKLQLES